MDRWSTYHNPTWNIVSLLLILGTCTKQILILCNIGQAEENIMIGDYKRCFPELCVSECLHKIVGAERLLVYTKKTISFSAPHFIDLNRNKCVQRS